MLPDAVAEMILTGHVERRRVLDIPPSLRLDLQLDYSGLMAKGSYKGYRKRWNEGRRKVGCFDFKIFRQAEAGAVPLVHKRVIEDALSVLSNNLVERVFAEQDPDSMSDNLTTLRVLKEVQLAMLEQEINWGDEVFQSKTYFLPSKGLRPRDFIMAYLRRGFEEPAFLGDSKTARAASGAWGVLPPPVAKPWKEYLEPSDSGQRPWLNGFLLDRFRKVAEGMPENPEYAKSYRGP